MTRLPHYRPHRPHWLSVYANSLGTRLLNALTGLPGLQDASESRLQRRLQHSLRRDRVFFELIRRKHAQFLNQPSWLSEQLSAKQEPRQWWRHGLVALAVGLSVGGATWTTMFVNERVTLVGVPYRVVHKFWQDKTARDAYFGGDSQALHARLQTLGVEEDIKAFYSDRFDSEYELDRYIHQLMFNQTGYVGEAYSVTIDGQLKPRAY
jgi:hypothetical protein